MSKVLRVSVSTPRIDVVTKMENKTEPNELAYFMVLIVEETGQQELWRPGLWYVRHVAEAGYGERIICAN